MPWAEALVAVNEEIGACERRFHRQCILVVELTKSGQLTAEDEMPLASHMTSLTLLRTHRDRLLAKVPTEA